MADAAFCLSEKHQAQHWRAEIKGANAELLIFSDRLCKQFKAYDVPLFPHCIVRDSHEQDRLYAEGRSKAQAGESAHNFGYAVDIVHGTKGWNLTARQWAFIGYVGKEIAQRAGIKITWGGDWKFYDPAHWEISDWRARILR